MYNNSIYFNFSSSVKISINKRPDAHAFIKGDTIHSKIRGNCYLYQTDYGVLMITEVTGLPHMHKKCATEIYAYHIHSGGSCTGSRLDSFANAGTHYNPGNCPHPAHAGDLPPLFGNNGYAFSSFITDRITVKEVIGKTLIIHSGVDDFTAQPSGNSMAKIACGKIVE